MAERWQAPRVALTLLGASLAAATTPSSLQLPDFSTLQPDSLYFLPFAGEKCGEGNPMFYGVVTPHQMTNTTKFWIENMGGAICFNEASCADSEFGVWLDTLKTIKRYLRTVPPPFGTAEALFGFLSSGAPIPLSMFRQLRIGYLPNGAGGPLEGEVGFYVPTCTGDAGLGNYKVTYQGGSQVVSHVGSASYMLLLQAIKEKYASADRVTLIGASGLAVSRVAWAPTVADLFPSAVVQVLADSAMHIFPDTEAFRFFWNEVQWSPNPNGRHDLAQPYASGMSLPTFDWRSPTAISDMLQHYAGRVRLLYIACNDDDVVRGDRINLAHYANITVPTGAQHVEEMWTFMKRLTRDAPAGSVFSYISEGTCHHQTRKGFVAAINASDASDLGPQGFTEGFLRDARRLQTAHQWCCGRTPSSPQTRTPSSPQTTELSSAASVAPSLLAAAVILGHLLTH